MGYNFKQSFIVDSGSDVCTLPFDIYKRHFTEPLRPCHGITLRNFDKSEIRTIDVLPNVKCKFSDRFENLDFIVCENAVIGANAISKLQLTVTGQTDQLITYSFDRTYKIESKPTESLSK